MYTDFGENVQKKKKNHAAGCTSYSKVTTVLFIQGTLEIGSCSEQVIPGLYIDIKEAFTSQHLVSFNQTRVWFI